MCNWYDMNWPLNLLIGRIQKFSEELAVDQIGLFLYCSQIENGSWKMAVVLRTDEDVFVEFIEAIRRLRKENMIVGQKERGRIFDNIVSQYCTEAGIVFTGMEIDIFLIPEQLIPQWESNITRSLKLFYQIEYPCNLMIFDNEKGVFEPAQ